MDKQEKSFDFKLMMKYHICMMVLLPLGLILPPVIVFSITACLIVVLSLISIIHKRKHGWNWVKPKWKGIGMSILSIVTGVTLIFVVTNAFGGFNGPIAPWVCAGIGITYFNFLSGLNFVDNTKEEFKVRLAINNTIAIKKEIHKDRHHRLKFVYKVFFLVTWFSAIYLFYSHSEYSKSYSKEKTEFKAVEVHSHGNKYFVNQDSKNLITVKSMFIIPLFVLSILFPFIMKFGFGIDLMNKEEQTINLE